MRTALILIIMSFALAACGFQPLYGDRGTGSANGDLVSQFASIEIMDARDREGQQLRNRLISRLTPRGVEGTPRYQLQFSLSEDVEGYAFRQDRAVTRERLQVTSQMVLVDLSNGKPVLEKENNAWVAYDIVQSDYATVAARRDARLRATDQLADRMMSALSQYFRKSVQSGGESQ